MAGKNKERWEQKHVFVSAAVVVVGLVPFLSLRWTAVIVAEWVVAVAA